MSDPWLDIGVEIVTMGPRIEEKSRLFLEAEGSGREGITWNLPAAYGHGTSLLLFGWMEP